MKFGTILWKKRRNLNLLQVSYLFNLFYNWFLNVQKKLCNAECSIKKIQSFCGRHACCPYCNYKKKTTFTPVWSPHLSLRIMCWNDKVEYVNKFHSNDTLYLLTSFPDFNSNNCQTYHILKIMNIIPLFNKTKT
jgi:hypothetical protein